MISSDSFSHCVKAVVSDPYGCWYLTVAWSTMATINVCGRYRLLRVAPPDKRVSNLEKPRRDLSRRPHEPTRFQGTRSWSSLSTRPTGLRLRSNFVFKICATLGSSQPARASKPRFLDGGLWIGAGNQSAECVPVHLFEPRAAAGSREQGLAVARLLQILREGG